MADRQIMIQRQECVLIAGYLTIDDLDFRNIGHQKPKIMGTYGSTALVGMLIESVVRPGEHDMYCRNPKWLPEYQEAFRQLAQYGRGVANNMNSSGFQHVRVIFCEGKFLKLSSYVRDRD
jgi:hypothetical protein